MELTKTCKESNCGKSFTVTDSEQEFFRVNQLSIPARCPGCRRARREARDNKSVQQPVVGGRYHPLGGSGDGE